MSLGIIPSRVRRMTATALGVIGLLLTSGAIAPKFAMAQAPVQTFKPAADPRIEERARAVGKELRCVVCQNQSIDESNAPLALDLKQLLRERLTAGDSDAQAKAFLVARYGNFVLLKPPFQFNTLLLWIGPFLLLGVAGWSVRRYFATPIDTTNAAPDLSADDLKRADQILEKGTSR